MQIIHWRYTSKYVFCGLSKMEKYLRKIGLNQRNKNYIGDKLLKDNINCFWSVFLSFCLSFHFFSLFPFSPSHSPLWKKSNISNDQRPNIKHLEYLSFLWFSSLKSLSWLLRKLIQTKSLFPLSFSPICLTNESQIENSANIDYLAQSLKLCCLYQAIRASFTI